MALIACGGSNHEAPSSPGGAAPPPPDPRAEAPRGPAPAPTEGAGAPAAAPSPASAGRPRPAASAAPVSVAPEEAKGPKNAAECRALLDTAAAGETDATITAGPGAGKSDRSAGIMDTMKQKRGAFRCCYELWAKDHPGRDAKVLLRVTLDPGGKVTAVEIKRDASDALSPEADGCILDLAKAIPFPPSPSDKLTTFSYELGFKHHKADG